MPRDITQADYDTAAPLIEAGRPDEETIAALKYRGLSAEDASKVVQKLKQPEAGSLTPDLQVFSSLAAGAVQLVAGPMLPYLIDTHITKLKGKVGLLITFALWSILWRGGFKGVARGARATNKNFRAQATALFILAGSAGVTILAVLAIDFILRSLFGVRK